MRLSRIAPICIFGSGQSCNGNTPSLAHLQLREDGKHCGSCSFRPETTDSGQVSDGLYKRAVWGRHQLTCRLVSDQKFLYMLKGLYSSWGSDWVIGALARNVVAAGKIACEEYVVLWVAFRAKAGDTVLCAEYGQPMADHSDGQSHRRPVRNLFPSPRSQVLGYGWSFRLRLR